MNVFIPDGRIDQFILEDMPYIDLTTEVLGIGEEPGEIEYFTREDCVLAGVEEAARVLGKTGARVIWSRRFGGAPRCGGAVPSRRRARRRRCIWRGRCRSTCAITCRA